MKWDPVLREHLKALDEKKPVVLTGDLNVAHNEIGGFSLHLHFGKWVIETLYCVVTDLANPKAHTRHAGFTKEERDGFTDLLNEGFVDCFREFYPDLKDSYTFWSFRGNARAKNVGWWETSGSHNICKLKFAQFSSRRLDYFVTSARLLPKVGDVQHRTDVKGSDHCPLVLYLQVWTWALWELTTGILL